MHHTNHKHSRRPSRRHILAVLFALALGAWLAPSPAAASDTLLLTVTERDERGLDGFWWQDTRAPRWTATDDALRAMMQEAGLHVIDPAAVADAPVVSRVVFGRPYLSSANALNLASLYKANRVAMGEVRYETIAAAPLLGEPGFRVHVDVHVFATTTTIELLPIVLDEVAYAPTLDEARAQAATRAFARVASMVRHADSLTEAKVGVDVAEPVMVITGLDQAQPLVDMKKALKERPEVVDVMERWAAEGVIAIEINPDTVDAPDLVIRAFDDLLRQPFEGFKVQEVSRDAHRLEVAIVPLRHREATPAP